MKHIKLLLVSRNKAFGTVFEEAAFLSGRQRIVTLLTESSCFLLGVFWFLKYAAWVERKESSLVECLFVCLFV